MNISVGGGEGEGDVKVSHALTGVEAKKVGFKH
jgi:hypothetical protein